MNIEKLVFDLNKQGVKLWVEGEQLRANAPKGVLTIETRDLLAKNKAEIISLLHDKTTNTNKDLSLIKTERPQHLPLSFAQEQLWLLNQLEPNNPFYNEQIAVKLHGQLNIVALEQSLNIVVARHEVLRTNFPTINEQPVQVIADSLTLSVPIVDLTHLPVNEREIACQKLASQEANHPFGLVNSPLIRASVIKLTEVEHALLITIHHIIFDGWSMGVLMGELATIYSALCNSSSPNLPELPIQYADFAIWQRQFLQTGVLQTQLDYWKQQLKNAPNLIELPTDRPRPAIQTYRGAIHYVQLSNELSQALTQFSRQEGATLFMTLFTAYATLLYRYTGQDDIVVGTPLANRDRLELEGLIGFFVNTLVLRTDLSGNPSFQELLSRVRRVTLQAYTHPDLPFEELVKALQPQRDLSHTPLFQVMFVLENAPTSEAELTGLTLSPLGTQRTTAKFDLTLFIKNTSSGLLAIWQYNTDLFDSSTIERIGSHFVTLLAGVVANPQQQISQLPLLTQVEQQQLLVEWNNTQVNYPPHQSIPQLFEEQVQRTPDAVAVEFGNQQLTYSQLNSRANQLANYLKSLGVKPDVLVGLCVERSLEMVMGLLGILKAGGAYLPLDPEYPTERLSFMLEDAQVSVLLTQQLLLDRLPSYEKAGEQGEKSPTTYQAQLVCLDTDWQLISHSSQENPITDVQADNLGYVIYTSGSTGKPKGVAMNQLSLCNLILWQRQNTTISHGAKTLQFAPISFDVSFQEIFSTWCSGGTLLLITEELRRDALALLGLIQEKAVARLFLPFVALQQLAEVAVDSGLVNSHLREIITAGEQLQITPAIAQWFSQLNHCTLHNNYGPSETHVATNFTLDNSVETWPLLPPIGKPITNTKIYILDNYLQPVPIGVPGELYIGGVSLARGYLKRPELTQEKFIPNPFEQGQGSRLYKTGDLARYLPDGNIEYLGRIDNQVKIRGFRIELGEIEAALSQYRDVQAACIIPREDTPGDKRLVAYVVAHQDSPTTMSELRQFLKAKLPDYMVPSAFVMLDALPLTPSGKVDRRALPAPDLDNEITDKYVAPRNPTEELLAQIWAQVLKVEKVGIHDNFFDLGGHSLLATQLISRIRNVFKVELPLRELFASAKISELARSLEQLQQHDLELSAQPIVPRTKNTDLPLSYAQQRLWFLDQFEPNSPSYNIPVALRLAGTLNQAALLQSLQEIIHRHEALRTNFVTVDEKATQVIRGLGTGDWGLGVISVVDLQHLPTTEQERVLQDLAQQQGQISFNLANEPLIRVTLVVLSETEHALFVCMHHIVSDGWSMGVFVQELAALYDAYSQDRQSPLTPLAIQYADFAIWQRDWLQGDVLQKQLSYWQQQLANAPTLLSLPTDRPRPSVQTFSGAYQEFALSVELTRKLVKLSQEQGCTLFMTLLAAYDTLLYRYTGQSDILVGSPIANRDRLEVEGLIGFFVNSLVMRTNLAGNPSFYELMGRVRDMAMDAYAHQDLPFEMLVEALQPERDLSHTPLFQVMFVLQNTPMSPIELTGLTVIPLVIKGSTAKFDLTLSMQNTDTGLVGAWEYNTDLFDASTIERMAGHFVTLLEGIVTNPQQQISQLPLLTAVEQQQLLVEWNATQVDYPLNKFIHHLFEEQVQRTPDAVAVVYENQQLTYQQLNHRANQLANYLHALGVKPDVLVGLCVERSLEMIVGLLGILKAGGAYLPLDPDYPQERLSFMLEDAQVPVLLTQQQLLENLPQHQAKVVCLDTDWQVISQSSGDNARAGVQASNLAYVIYTSGSTGRPKGVMISHGAIANHCCIIQQAYALEKSDRVLQFASINFDASLEQIFPTLIAGATLVLRGSDVWTPTKFQKIISDFGLTVVNLPTAYWQQLTQEWVKTQALDSNSQLRLVLVGGDAILPEYVAKWQRSPMFCVRLVNAYGPTETTITATLFEIPPQWSKDGNLRKMPIGRPLPNRTVYILDRYLQPVPLGVPGELYIGGMCLAKGYLNRPELTQERFISNPFGYGRLYKTGDLVRYLPDGNIEYLDRIDNQVKIRGFRIELGEIEAVLNTHPEIQQAVVIVREDIPGNKRLVAYVVTSDESLSNNQLRQFLKQQLPEYMIPSGFVTLDKLPLTPNGKIDRKALPTPDGEINRENEYVAPRTLIEQTLTNIWQQLLLKEKVSIHDNFFEIGGDSILSIQVVSRAKNAGIQITPKQIFQNQTIAGLAQVANTTVNVESKQGVVTGVAPLTPIQHWFFEQNKQDSHHYNQSVLLQVPNHLQSELVTIAVQKLLEHHDALRLKFTSVADEYKQINQGLDDSVPFTVVDLSSIPKDEQAQALEKIAAKYQASLNLSTGAIMQAVMFNLGDDSDARLLIIVHHLAVDGVSWRILLSDLEAIYQQLITPKPVELSAKTTAFIDWAEKLNDYAQSATIKDELDYWLNQPWSEITPLPLDCADIPQENTVGSSDCVSVTLSHQETQTLLLSVNEAYNTQINDILLSALAISIAEWAGNLAVIIDLEGHGREELFTDVDLSRTVGWFTSLFPVLLQLPAFNQTGEIIKSIKEQLRAIPHRGIGYGILRYLCQDRTVQEKIQTIPSPEISFNYLGQFDQVQSETGWKFAPEPTGDMQSLKQTRDHLLDINALVIDGQLRIEWTYNSYAHSCSTVEKLAQSYLQAIASIIEHCQLAENRGFTPSDFPDAQLNQLQVDELLTQFLTKNIESIYPLSPSQQGMLFETLAASESGIHLEQSILNLQIAEFDLLAFAKAWQSVVNRHSILRTAFTWENQNEPLQVVLKEVEISLEQQDWRGISVSQQQAQLDIYLSADRLRGFDMSKPPLMRFALFQVSTNTYQFVWTSHHILTDGWCVPLIFKEVFAFYEAFSKGQDLSLEPSHPYRNYIAWLKQQDLSQAENFWRNKLQGFKSPTPLGIEAEPMTFSDGEERYGEQKARLSASATAALQSLVRQHHLSLNILLQGVWGLLLSRYSGLEDVVFGATFSGRPPELVGSESMLGLFINTLPMRLLVPSQASLWSWLKDIQEQNFTQRDYEYCSQGQIHEWSEVPGSLPLYESLLVFQNYPVDSSAIQSANYENNQSQDRSIGAQTKYALTILVSPTSQLEFRIIYQRSRYDHPAINLILEHFQALLNSIVDLPEQSLATLIDRISSEQIPQVRGLPKLIHKEQRKAFNAPRNLWEFQLVQIWEDILGIHPVSVQDNFFELGGHSLLAVRLVSRIQKHFQINLPLSILFQYPTIEQLSSFLDSPTDTLSWSALVPIRIKGNLSPLFCVHPGGGNVLCYHHLAYYLHPERPFYGLQCVGLNPQNQPHTSIEQMATHYIKELQTVQPHGPYFLSGWSFGGLVAFEMAQQLSRQGEQIALLALIDTTPPALSYQGEIDYAFLLVELFKDRLEICLEELRQLAPEEQVIYVVEQAKQKNIYIETFDFDQAPHLLKILQINAQALQDYQPQFYSGSIVLLKAAETEEDFESSWKELVEQIETVVVPGNHISMMSPPHIQILVQKIQDFLE
ncbi:amino acid adenylation domain-containing protein [Nostoc parmelioides FACHB-3921]|uniref:Amino acid adenylation domain-containing protein n=1 Tax=Nostoc parmelioides FACHB-3921 TaxID=2692909 RepID=A0ABR8BJ97_9NOSO|nr:amino acid adenylation domain-containing protein [Nostoc parmelioides FACHB-3921]